MFNRFKASQGGFDYSDIEYLVEKNYLADFSSPNVLMTKIENGEKKLVKDFKFIELFIVTPKFKEGIFVDNEEAALEAWKAFPAWMTINGQLVNVRNMEYQVFEEQYELIINGNGILHKTIVEAFTSYKKFVKDGKVQGMGIKKAIEKKLWDDIAELIVAEQESKDVTGSL